MPIPVGTVPIGGPILDVSGALLVASPALRDAGVVSFREGRLRKVNAAGDDWVDIPGHIISATEPTEVFEGQLWYDTANDAVKSYDGSAFVALGGGAGDITAVTTATDSGLAGGADSGDADLTLSINNLEGQTGIAGGDHLGFDDVSATTTKRITVQNFAAHLAPTSGGLAPTTAGQLHVRLHGMPSFSAFEGSDELGLTDDSATNKVTKKATLEDFSIHLAGTGLTADSEGRAVGGRWRRGDDHCWHC